MPGGYMGRILRVDLTSGKTVDEELPDEDLLKKHVGCYGLGLRFLYDMLPAGYSASDPENPLVFLNGPLTGLGLPGATNISLTTKNFDTGITVGRSHTHGTFGVLLKKAGYDGLIVSGRADKPVYLWVNNGKTEIRDASRLWGIDSHQTEDLVKTEIGLPEASVAAIGPAGENLCAGGMICNDKNHSFSHSGVGSVMGSKKLKAIAVFGDRPIPVADGDKLKSVARQWRKSLGRPGGLMSKLGQQRNKRIGEYRYNVQLIGLCGRNFQINQLTDFGLGWSKQKWTPRPCPGCPFACPFDVEITSGPYEGHVATVCGGGEALEGAGSILGITDPGSIYYLVELYDRLGVEGSVAGCTLAMAFEAYEKGLITSKDTDGLELRWGDVEVAASLFRKLVNRKGFGDILARGIKEAADWIGGEAPDFAVHIKGSGMSLHDWRSVWGLLFGQIVGSAAGWPAPGADCFTAEPDAGYPELTDRFDWKSKPMEVRQTGILKFIHDCTGMCWFCCWGVPGVLQLSADAVSAATGWDLSPEELWNVGERVMHLERAFNVKHGLTPHDDLNLPTRLIEAPADGPGAGRAIKPYLPEMIKDYYHVMGWNEKSGKPQRTTLQKFGLHGAAKELWG